MVLLHPALTCLKNVNTILALKGMDTKRESPPSLCNGLGTIYIISFSRKDLSSYYQSMCLEFRYALRRVLGTLDHPTPTLASHRCVLCINPIKN